MSRPSKTAMLVSAGKVDETFDNLTYTESLMVIAAIVGRVCKKKPERVKKAIPIIQLLALEACNIRHKSD